MTFEDFINQERPWLQNLNQIEQYKLVWNAAISSSLNAVDVVVKQQIDENDVHVYIHDGIKKLLTA